MDFYPPIVGNGTDAKLYLGTWRLFICTDCDNTSKFYPGNTPTWTAPGGPQDLTAGGSDVLSAIGVAKSNNNVIYTGSRQGQVRVSTNGGSTWTNINGVVPNRVITSITVSPIDPNLVYLTVSGYASGHIFRTTNGGSNWFDISNNLPNIPTNAFLIDPLTPTTLYAGTDIGVFRSTDNGANWVAFNNGLPPAAVMAFSAQSSGLIQLATYGRSAYELTPTALPTVQFASPTLNVNEGAGSLTIEVTRTGDTAGACTVNYLTSDTAGLAGCSVANGKASERCDYETAAGTLRFAAGETSKSFVVPVVNDVHVEGSETFAVTLSAPTGASLGLNSIGTVTINDNDLAAAVNPIDDPTFFITQQYFDFLGRLPDPGGLAGWLAVLNGCPNGGFGENDNPSCDRVHISSGFFLSPEFQGRGYWAYRFYEVGLDRRPAYAEFVPDMALVGGPQSPQSEALSKAAYTDDFPNRPEFKGIHDSLSNSDYVNRLEQYAGVPVTNKAALVTALDTSQKSRGQVLREIVESQAVENQFFVRAFVAMQYFGYLRRDPDASGFDGWVTTLMNDPADSRHMIYGFLYSSEYRGRFGPQ
jgi:hypothetical protein